VAAKTQIDDKSDLGGDYTLAPVPLNRRKHWLDVALVWMGMNICPPSLLLGVWLMRYQSFANANLSLIFALILLALFSIFQGIIGTKLGLPTYPISQLALGDWGGRLFSFVMFLTLIGWFGIMTESLVSTFYSQIFSAAHISLAERYRPFISFGAGMVITAICFWGFRAITWLNRLTIPGLLFLTLFALVKILQQPELVHRVLHWHAARESISVYQGTIWVVGSLIIAAVTAPDFNRYCRTSKDTVYSVLLGNIPMVYFLAIMGMAFAVLSGAAEGKSAIEAADLSAVFAKQGWNIGPLSGVLVASFILIGAIITTNVVNLYPGAMALVTVVKGSGKYWPYLEDRAVLTIFVGFLGSVAAAFGILAKFEFFLEILTYFSVPLIGIMSTDFFLLKNRSKMKGKINISSIIIWLGFSLANMGHVVPGGALATVVYSGILYFILEKIFGDKLHWEVLK